MNAGFHRAAFADGLRDSAWQERAKCRGFLDFTELETADQLRICRGCPVTAPCIEHGLAQTRTPYGAPAVYGGLRPSQFAQLVRERNEKERERARASFSNGMNPASAARTVQSRGWANREPRGNNR